jgi:hypothetical protein
MREEFNPFIKSCTIRTDPATETKSIGLQADARVVMVFARHLDNFILTKKFCTLTGTLHAFVKTSAFKAKTHANPDTPRYRSGQAAATHYTAGPLCLSASVLQDLEFLSKKHVSITL